MLSELNHNGVSGNVNKLIKSYLDNRKQYVLINGVDSEIMSINSAYLKAPPRDLFYC